MDFTDIRSLFDQIDSLAYDIRKLADKADRIALEDVMGAFQDISSWASSIETLAGRRDEVMNYLIDLDDTRDQALDHIRQLGAYGEACKACPAELECLLNK